MIGITDGHHGRAATRSPSAGSTPLAAMAASLRPEYKRRMKRRKVQI
jgi:hypothetical protein